VCAVLWALLFSFTFVALAHAATLPPSGFEDRKVTAAPQPTALAFAPDGRILITERAGQVRILTAAGLLSNPALDLGLNICLDNERGLLGVAVDPSFAVNHFIYLYYTFKKFGSCDTQTPTVPVNRISRFTLGNNNVVDPASELVLVDNIPSVSGVHNAGSLRFGRDGYLYASVGDSGCDYANDSGCSMLNDSARDLSGLEGKVLRITADGGIPPGNPYRGPGTERCNVNGRASQGGKCQEIFASGLRNPWQLAFDPNGSGNSFYINDVGESSWEEINLGQAGADYGWNVREGFCARDSTTNCGPPPVGMTNPLFAYPHQGGCSAVTGGAFVPAGAWPSLYDGAFLFADFGCGQISRLVALGGGSYTQAEFATGASGALVAMAFGPSPEGPALYYLSLHPDEIRRVVYTGAPNRRPQAEGSVDPAAARLPASATFSSTGSSDPEGGPLTYDWNFDDGSAHSAQANPTHVYNTAGLFHPRLTVRDDAGNRDTVDLTFRAGDAPPVATISSPTPSQLFSVGERITLVGSATDFEDGTLPDGALIWTVYRHHDFHVHPYVPQTSGNNVIVAAPAPEDIQAADSSYLEIYLTATDSQGVSKTIMQVLRPKTVDLTFQTNPSGAKVEVAGSTLTAPQTVTSWAGWNVQVVAPNQTGPAGEPLVFTSWSDGGARSHVITAPSAARTYSATFTTGYPRPRGATLIRAPLVPAYVRCNAPNSSHGAPLAFASCSPPVQASDQATIGTPDANGRPSRSVGSVTMRAMTRIPATPQDDADVSLKASIGDVLRRSNPSQPYLGQAYASVVMRATDRLNGSTGTDTGTVRDFEFKIPLACAAGGPGGSTCSANTTADALVPGWVIENKRTIWQLGPIQVFDGGPDGDMNTRPNTLFATQGVFLP
jgi:glucose/arabinose dehydrogenase